MKVKNNKFQKGDIASYRYFDAKGTSLLGRSAFLVRIKTVFAVEDSYRYLVEYMEPDFRKLKPRFVYVDEVNLDD